jgi:hypothetical protein
MDPRERDAKEAKAKEKQALLDRAFDRIIGSQLKKISSLKQVSEQDEENYRKGLEQERIKASKRKRKALSKEHDELARTTGLSAQVVALMAKSKDDADDDDDSRDFKKAKKKKRKKEKRSSREKGAHGESKSRKRKKNNRKHHKNRKSSSSEGSSSIGEESSGSPEESTENGIAIEGKSG